jgi:RNA polymerase sigma factor (sigma-70 family)
LNFGLLYKEHKDLVYNLSLQYVQNAQDAQEISQDVFLKIYEKRNSFKGNSSLKTWIYRITINTSLDFIKAKKRDKRGFFFSALRIDGPDCTISIPNFNHPGVQMEDKEGVELIFTAINRLPLEQKTIIILLRLEEKTQAETAEIIGKSTKAVESLYQRAKKNLHVFLNENEG